MRDISFIHAADLHLDSPLKGMEHHMPTDIIERAKESSFVSLHRIVDKAIEEKVDFVLFAGDIYDSEHRSIRAQIKFRKEMERLNKEGIEVFLIHGNHDFLMAKGNRIDLPENVHIFGSDVEFKAYQDHGETIAHIYGFSYGQRAVTENLTPYYQKKEGVFYHIGMLHGSVEQSVEHDTYAPFQISQLQEKEFDYWALGHIHKRQELSAEPPIIYAGNIQGRHKKELGDKGCYLVRLSKLDTKYEFYPTNDITWKQVNMSLTGIEDTTAFLRECVNLLEKEREMKKGVFLTVIFQGESILSSLLKEYGTMEEFLTTLLDSEEGREDFVWIVSYKDETYENAQVREESFLGEVLTLAKEYSEIDELLAPITETAFSRKIGMSFSEEEQEEIQKEAEALLLHFFREAGER